MLSTRKPDAAPNTSASVSQTVYPAKPPSIHSTSPYQNNADVPHSVVDKHLTMKGDLESEGDVLVKGKVLGKIRCKLLIIDVEALVEGGIEAEDVVIRGTAKGTITANRVRLEPTAIVDSEIVQNSFSAEEGARVKGTLRLKNEVVSSAVKDGLTLAA